MNCAVCGNPLLFDRVAFHCSCGVYVHSYCWNQHVLEAHKPDFEMGTVDLNGDFQVIEPELSEVASEEVAETAAGEGNEKPAAIMLQEGGQEELQEVTDMEAQES